MSQARNVGSTTPPHNFALRESNARTVHTYTLVSPSCTLNNLRVASRECGAVVSHAQHQHAAVAVQCAALSLFSWIHIHTTTARCVVPQISSKSPTLEARARGCGSHVSTVPSSRLARADAVATRPPVRIARPQSLSRATPVSTRCRARISRTQRGTHHRRGHVCD